MAAARDLAGLLNSSANVSALDRHYRRTMKRILDELSRGVTQPGSARARDLIARIRKLTNDLDPRKDSFVRKWIRKQIPRAFVLGDDEATANLRRQLRQVSGAKVQDFGQISRSFTGANSASLRGVVQAMESQLSRAASDILATANMTIARTRLPLLQDKAIREATVGGLIRGATGRQLSDDIAKIILTGKATPNALKNLREKGFGGSTIDLYKQLSKGQFITVGKRRFNVRTFANLVARTQSREAHKVATVVRLQQNGVDHVQISRHAQLVKDECTPFAGKVFYVGSEAKDPAGFPKLSSILNGGPPFHPNCRHVTLPYVIEFQSESKLEAAQESAKALPNRFFGKSAKDVRDLVNDLTAAQLKEIAVEGAEDLREAA